MFGIDWDGDGEESLSDDMITMDVIDDFGMDDTAAANSSSGGGCLAVTIGLIAVLILIFIVIFLGCAGILII